MTKSAIKPAPGQVLDRAKKALAAIDARLVARVVAVAKFLAGRPGKVVTCGVGKSGFIAAKVASTLTSLGVRAVAMHPTDAVHGDLGIVEKGDAFLVFSHSGATRELVQMLAHVRVPVIAVTGNARSHLAVISTHVLAYRLASEGSPHDLAPMASTTVSLVLGDMLAAQVATLRGFTRERFAQLHPAGSLGLQLVPIAEVMLTGSRMPKVRTGVPFRLAVRRINDKRLGITAVIDRSGRLVGVLTDGDVRRFVLSSKEINQATVEDAMTVRPRTIAADASLADALKTMEERKITSLFVVADGKPHGVIHMHQIVERQLA